MILHDYTIVDDIHSSTTQFNDDLKKISEWAYQWKMSINPNFFKKLEIGIFTQVLILS